MIDRSFGDWIGLLQEEKGNAFFRERMIISDGAEKLKGDSSGARRAFTKLFERQGRGSMYPIQRIINENGTVLYCLDGIYKKLLPACGFITRKKIEEALNNEKYRMFTMASEDGS